MRLVYGPLSMFSAKAAIAICEKGLACEYDEVPFSLADRYHPRHPDVLRYNPKEEVPVLFDGDVVVYDSTQIFEYLEDAYPAPALWPEDVKRRVAARRLELESDEVLFTPVITIIRNVTQLDSEIVKQARADIQAAYDHFEAALAGEEFVAGEFTYADIALICAHYFATFLGSDLAPRHTQLAQWRRRVASRPSAKPVLAKLGEFLTANGLPAPAFDEA